MKFEQLKNAMDSKFLDVQKNTICMDYLLDSIEIIMNNTYYIVMQIENKRVRPYNPPFNALLELCQNSLIDEYGINDRPTTKQLEKYFNCYGIDYKELLQPLTKQVIEIRLEMEQ